MKELVYEVGVRYIGVRYSTFTFDDANEAMTFATCAKEHSTDDTSIEIHVLEKKDEEQE